MSIDWFEVFYKIGFIIDKGIWMRVIIIFLSKNSVMLCFVILCYVVFCYVR